MWPFGITAIAWMLIPTQGGKCSDNQQCTECEEQTGRCSTNCSKGYFGPKCLDVCSRRCRYHTCELHLDRGIGRCTDGCIPGFQGSNCQRPCYSTKEDCTRCPGGCDGEYCRMGGACFSGCSDSYYGAGCRTCSRGCKSCNRITGTCEECQPPYSGLDCRSSCEHCVGGCESGCQQGCRQGFYGDNCTEACSVTCRADPTLSTDEQCPEGDSCTPEGHSQTGECVHGCVDGWYGPKCSRRCNSNCTHHRCNGAGACIEGCAPGHVRSDCELCLLQCVNLTCALNNGSCCNGCSSSLLVESCNLSCNVCLDSIVGMNTSVCILVKNITQYMCGYNCTNNDSSPSCPAGSCVTDSSPIDTETVKYLVVFGICILAASTVGYCCYRRGLSAKIEDTGSQTGTEQPESRTCQHSQRDIQGDQSEHIYDDTDEDDTGPVIVYL